MVTFTEEVINRKLHILRSVKRSYFWGVFVFLDPRPLSSALDPRPLGPRPPSRRSTAPKILQEQIYE